LTPEARDRLAPYYREAILDIKRQRPFPHQAAFWAAIDGWVLTEEVVESFPLASPSDLTPYYQLRTPIPHGTTDVLVWSGDEDDPDYRIERRRLTPRPQGPSRFAADLAAYKAGKAVSLSTVIPTPSGYKRMRDVRVGDKVFDETGRPCSVKWCSPVHISPQGCYRVTFDDGTQIVASGEHEWWTFDLQQRASKVRQKLAYRYGANERRGSGTDEHHQADDITGSILTTQEMAGNLRNKHGQIVYGIPTAKAWRAPERSLPLDPYLLGVWLGDGHTSAPYVTSDDPEVLYEFEKAGFPIKSLSAKYVWKIERLLPILKSMNLLHNKHVPADYMLGSVAQRLALLQGLMDSDGYCSERGRCEFCNTNQKIARAVYRLASSLNIKARFKVGRATLNGKDCGPKYRVFWQDVMPVFRLARKLERLPETTSSKQRFRYIHSCERIPDEPVKCIEVDSPSHLYLAGEAGIPTHNSFEGGILIASELMVPNNTWDIIGTQYTICEPEFLYVADVLLGDSGFNLPVKGQDGFNGKLEDGTPYPSLWCTSFQNSVGVGRMKIALSNGSVLECKSWESGEGLKGKERDGYLWAESYQFGTIKPFATLKQNLRARDGKSLFPTTPDHAWVDVLRQMGESDLKIHKQWFCHGDVKRQENPFTFDADEMEADRSIMTREQHAISWEGKLGTYIGSVFEHRRGQRQFNCETHPHLWRDVRKGPVFSNLLIPDSWTVRGGGDTGTKSAACWAAFSDDDPTEAFFVAGICNYRYVATQIEELRNYSMLTFYERVHEISAALGCRPSLYADPNSQFKSDWWNTGAVRLLKGTASQEHRTERLRALFQHNRIWIAPWMDILDYELEVARFPPEETSTGKWARVKKSDHMLDGAEHLAAQDPSGKPPSERAPMLAIESILNIRQKPASPQNPWGL